jgi:hypothetical protein
MTRILTPYPILDWIARNSWIPIVTSFGSSSDSFEDQALKHDETRSTVETNLSLGRRGCGCLLLCHFGQWLWRRSAAAVVA